MSAQRRRPKNQRPGQQRPGLETTELRTIEHPGIDAPPPPDAVAVGAYPAVLSGAATSVVGAIMVVIAALVLVDAARLPTTSDPLGPAAMPYVVGGLMGIVGLALVVVYYRFALVLVRVRRNGIRRTNGLRFALALLALIAFAIVLPFAGFFVSAALLFVVFAILLGTRPRWNLLIPAVLLSGAIVLIFDRLIGLTLPAGPWGF